MRYPTLIAAAIGLFALAFGISGCGESATDSKPRYPYAITTTVGMITDVVRNVAGDRAEVEGLIGSGVDPHLYKPTRNDVAALETADVIFYNGLNLEGKMGTVLVSIARKGKPVHAVTETILQRGDYVMNDAEGSYDPHVWMDVGGWMHAVDVVERALADYDPDDAAGYAQRADAYRDRLKELDAYVARVIGSIPEQRRVLITAHDAFQYMGRAYDLQVRGIQGLSTASEAGVQDIERLIDFIVEREIPAVFVETSVADKNVNALVEGARARGHRIEIGGELFSDAMGPPGTYEGTYIGMIDHNATTIARALGGEAPAGGMQGKLSIHD